MSKFVANIANYRPFGHTVLALSDTVSPAITKIINHSDPSLKKFVKLMDSSLDSLVSVTHAYIPQFLKYQPTSFRHTLHENLHTTMVSFRTTYAPIYNNEGRPLARSSFDPVLKPANLRLQKLIKYYIPHTMRVHNIYSSQASLTIHILLKAADQSYINANSFIKLILDTYLDNYYCQTNKAFVSPIVAALETFKDLENT